ncbi:mitochondrial inner-membrane-bound regulator-domain-containing protein [Trichophaea hybrida]|nr:mitochondrial inner-membrane-bound regulator-domain-containing protein [Trichophaea hybrida]
MTRAIGIRASSKSIGYPTSSTFHDESSTPLSNSSQGGAKTKSGQDLIVLGPLRPRPLPSIDGLRDAVEPLSAGGLAELSKSILTYEREAELDSTKMEISLLKPLERRVSKQRFEQLYSQLFQAFNLFQLRSYYDSAVPESSTTPKLAKSAPKMDTIRWIMQYRWGMEIAEEIAEREDVIVVETIETNKRDIFFLIGEDGRILRYWAHRGNARITVDVANNLLSIRASRASIEEIQKWLAHLLNSILTETLDISATSRIAPLGDGVIPVIARMTNTFIERIDNRTLRIAGLGPEKTRMDDARRLLLSSIDLRLRSKESLLFNPPMDNARKGALFPFSEGSALPWTFRNHNWGRWKLITPKPLQGISRPKFAMDTFNIIRRLDGGRGSLETVREALDQMGGNIPQDLRERGLATEYEAIIGHLLYNINTDDYNIRADHYELDMPSFIQKFHDKPRIICNAFPGIPVFSQDPIRRSNFEIPAPSLQGASSKEYFQLRFLPSPWSNPTSFERYPPVRMTVEIDSIKGTPHTPRIFALGSECNADVLLPRLPCDLRFVRRDETLLNVLDNTEQGGVHAGEWARFMEESHLNPSQDLKLRASPKIQIHIPPWMVLPSAWTPTASVAAPIDYTFTGMEYRRVVSLEEKGYLLSRTVVEGGVSGGRRTEVKLQYVPPSRSPSDPTNGHGSEGNGEGVKAASSSGSSSVGEGFVAFVNKAISFVASVDGFLSRKGSP